MATYIYNNATIYYEVHGCGKPVLLIHGACIDHHFLTGCMEPVFADFSDCFKRYYIDLPGMGQSTPGNILCADDIVEMLLHFIKDVIKEEKILLAGNSFGGMLSRAINCKTPKAVSGMLLICPLANQKDPRLPEMYPAKKEEAFLETLSEKELEHFCSMNAVLTKNAWQQYARDIYPAVLANEGKYYLEHVLDGSIPEYLVNAKETYDCPVLVLTGKQDSCVGYEDQFLWLKQYPKLSYVALEGAAHNLPIDKPQVFNALAKDWFLQFV